MSPYTCVHFNGMQNEKCARGVAYEVNWPNGPKPCITHIEKSPRGGTRLKAGESPIEVEPFGRAAEAKPCPFRETPTDEQVQQHRREADAHLLITLAALAVAGKWRVKPKPAHDRAEVVECPICKGRLHLSQSSYNGHVHGKCETAGCVSWME